MSKSLVNAIENLEDYVKKLETVVNIDSGTTDTQGVTKVAKQFVVVGNFTLALIYLNAYRRLVVGSG